MQLKTFQIIHDEFGWECQIGIDMDVAIPNIIDMVEFWNGWQTRLQKNERNYIKTFLKQLAAELLRLAIERRSDKVDAIGYFNAGAEGWTKMDGSQGIEIIYMDTFPLEFEDEDFLINEI